MSASLLPASVQYVRLIDPDDRVSTIKTGFLEGCQQLVSLDTSELGALTKIEDRFLSECRHLRRLNASGLVNVKSLGDKFLYGCSSLINMDFTALNSTNEIYGTESFKDCHNLDRTAYEEFISDF